MSKPEIGIVMAHEADLKVMQKAANFLDKFGVAYSIDILALHHNPWRAADFATNARKNGLKVIIAGAGGAAHLPGMIAAYTALPVIGVPIKLKHSIDGLDAIYSMLQMPTGVPVATMALNNAENAALFSIQVLGTNHPSYTELAIAYKQKRLDESERRIKLMQEMGHNDFYEEHVANRPDPGLDTINAD